MKPMYDYHPFTMSIGASCLAREREEWDFWRTRGDAEARLFEAKHERNLIGQAAILIGKGCGPKPSSWHWPQLATAPEPITWHDFPGPKLPDDSTTVLLELKDGGEPTWPGYLDDDKWRCAEGFDVTDKVTGWADMPTGRQAPQQ